MENDNHLLGLSMLLVMLGREGWSEQLVKREGRLMVSLSGGMKETPGSRQAASVER